MTAPANSIHAVAPAWRSEAVAQPHALDPARIQPYRGRLLVLPEKTPDRTAGGIIVPDSSREREQRGRVLAVGQGKLVDGREVPIDIAPGQVVLFNRAAGRYTGTTVKLASGEEAIIIEEDDVIAVYHEGSP